MFTHRQLFSVASMSLYLSISWQAAGAEDCHGDQEQERPWRVRVRWGFRAWCRDIQPTPSNKPYTVADAIYWYDSLYKVAEVFNTQCAMSYIAAINIIAMSVGKRFERRFHCCDRTAHAPMTSRASLSWQHSALILLSYFTRPSVIYIIIYCNNRTYFVTKKVL